MNLIGIEMQIINSCPWNFSEVIIEPYWNWNVTGTPNGVAVLGYNWTLLELKFKNQPVLSCLKCVIIEPYWNWNLG